MAAYNTTSYATAEDSATAVLTLLKTQINTVTDTKVIRYADVIALPNKKFVAVAIYDA